jgi:hypothetical protein
VSLPFCDQNLRQQRGGLSPSVRGVLAFFRRRKPPQPITLVDDGTFEVVAESFDPAGSDVAVLSEAERAGADLDRSMILRHAVEVPEAASSKAKQQFAADGYLASVTGSDSGDPRQLRADRTVPESPQSGKVTGLMVAQERARVAGLVARLGGDVHGWQLLAPPAGDRGRAGYDRGDR